MSQYSDDMDHVSVQVGEGNNQADAVTGTAFAIESGQAVTIRTDGTCHLASAASGSADLPCIGVATTRVKYGEWLTIKRRGTVRDVTGITVGGRVYLSDTPGAFSMSAGNTSQYCGFSDQGDETFYLNPDLATNAPEHATGS